MLYLCSYVLFSTSWHCGLPSAAFGRKEISSFSSFKCMAVYFKGKTSIRLALVRARLSTSKEILSITLK